MEMISSLKHSLDLNLRNIGKKKGAIREAGDGDGQLRLGYISEEIEERTSISRHEPLRSEGYVVQFKTNPGTRQYSGNVQRLSRRLTSLNALHDNLSAASEVAERLEAHLAVTAEDSAAYYQDPGELLTFATEMEVHRKGASEEVQKLRSEGVAIEDGTRTLRIDLSDPGVAATSLREFQGATRAINEFAKNQLKSANHQLEQMVQEKTPHLEKHDESETPPSGDPLTLFMREVHSEMLDAGQQMIRAQANLDPVKVYELLSDQ